MSGAAILFMTVSVSAVVGFAGWCYWRVLRSERSAGNRPDSKEET